MGRQTRSTVRCLALTGADADRRLPKKDRIVLNGLVSEGVDVMQIQADEKDQTLRCETTVRMEVLGDYVTLRQALLNILDNALLYTPAEGEISVSRSTDHNGTFVIEVADNGPGIAPDHAERVFGRCYRTAPGAPNQTGTGDSSRPRSAFTGTAPDKRKRRPSWAAPRTPRVRRRVHAPTLKVE